MAESIGPKIEVKGEKEFKQSLREIDGALRVNKAEMEKLSTEYDKNDKSVTGLTKKNEALDLAILNQTDKVKILEQALTNAQGKYGSLDTRTMRYREQLVKAETELMKMTKEYDKNTAAMQENETGSLSLADAITKVVGVAGIQMPPALNSMVSGLDGISASGLAAIGVLAAIVGTLGKLTIETSQLADELLTMSMTTGLSTDKLQEFRYASELIDVSMDTLDGSMTKMIRSMNEARNGSANAEEAFKKLHVRFKEGNGALRDADTVFYEIIDALGKMRNETDRDAIAMQIFGRSARDLNPLIEQGSDALKEYAQQAHETGYVIDNNTLQKFGALDDLMQKFTNTTKTLKNSLSVALLPALTGFMEVISGIPPEVLQTLTGLVLVIATVVSMAKAFKEVSTVIVTFTGGLGSADTGISKTTLKIMGIVAALIALAAIIAYIIALVKNRNIQQDLSAFGQISPSMNNIPKYARGTKYHQGGPALVGENGPEIVDMRPGAKVYQTGTGPSGGDVFYVTIDAKNVREFNDIVDMAQRKRQQQRAGSMA